MSLLLPARPVPALYGLSESFGAVTVGAAAAVVTVVVVVVGLLGGRI